MTTRRHVLALLASAPALGACGDGPDPAAAWRDPGAGETDPRRFALAHAILAPNPHNTQPWLVELSDDANTITLYCDLDRRLPFTDPNDRQITVGCGAFLEVYRIAASSLGHLADVTPFPDGEPTSRLDERPIARVTFLPQANATPDPLFQYVLARRTNRNVYDPRAPDDRLLLRVVSALPAFASGAAWTTTPDRVAALRDLVRRAFERELRTEGAQRETYQWLRFGRTEAAQKGDGLALEGPMIGVAKTLGLLGEDDFLNPDSTANQSALRDWSEMAESSPAFMWLSTANDRATTRLESGMAYARLNLAATALGLAMHPWSQALQEYEAMADLYAEAKRLLDAERQTIQMLVRVGYAAPVEPSARRGLEAILRPASP